MGGRGEVEGHLGCRDERDVMLERQRIRGRCCAVL